VTAVSEITTAGDDCRLAQLPTDRRGIPIPFITEFVDGVPDFRLTDLAKWRLVCDSRCCGICGGQLGYWVAFIGHDELVRARVFWDPPMHVTCARYSIENCPFLALSGARRSGRALPEGDFTVPPVRARPARVALYITRDYTVIPLPTTPNNLALAVGPAHEIEWF
jgi:hypothetical protein